MLRVWRRLLGVNDRTILEDVEFGPDDDVVIAHVRPQQLHLDLTVDTVAELDAVHRRVLALGGKLRLDRSDDPEEPLRVYTDRDGHTFCVFVG